MSTVPTATAVNPLLARYLAQLAHHPLRTKALTSGTLCLLQEVLGSHLAGVPPSRISKNLPFVFRLLAKYHFDLKAVKMALYGLLVSAPLSHVLVGALQKAFTGKTGIGARVGQILASNLLIAPIQTTAYLASIAIINGAASLDNVKKTVQAGFFPALRIQWVVSPISITVAQRFVPVHLWVPFFNLISFVLGTAFNARIKSMKLAAQKKDKKNDTESK
ncbi:hypothetical protein CYLTODRAFT_399177 [Cylindrobasidium torrendii FP15055 ss-10]|uniref:Integral membrane protein n=1 Tax=Cylindrobasidium torrendii FP15055 ss-10 TaxID=1314674 RepID=A0A0D7B6M8_9AGAR|nr:hypothetical protein CYLTODRAFT_399177 [Cylindrobasidium torrendii FP15055 ss-10]